MKKGFTLIELLVVVLIIGILSSIALPQYKRAVKKSRMAELQVAADAIAKKMTLYYMENGNYDGDFFGATGITEYMNQLRRKKIDYSSRSSVGTPTIRKGIALYFDDKSGGIDIYGTGAEVEIRCIAPCDTNYNPDKDGKAICNSLGYTRRDGCGSGKMNSAYGCYFAK